MAILVLITLVGLSFAPFLMPMLDIWHAQGMWSQVCILVLFSTTFFLSPKNTEKKNIPLGILHLWVGLFTAFICFKTQISGKYNITAFFPYFNFLCLLMFYKVIVQYLNIKDINRILTYLRYVLIGTCILCTLQKFELAQFFKMYFENHWSLNNPVVGMIGNGTHLSGFLAMCSPLLFRRDRESILGLVLLILVLFFTGTSVNDPSISGFFIIFVLWVIYCFYKFGRKTLIYIGVPLILVLTFLVLNKVVIYSGELKPYINDGHHVPSPIGYKISFFSDNGRFEWWSYYWGVFNKFMPITGYGLGKINEVYKLTPFPSVRHLHLEYFQFMFELGIIGFVLIINVILDFLKRRASENSLVLKLIVIGFLISCLFNYPAHLWLPSMIAMFAYAGFMLEEDIYHPLGRI